MFTDSLRPNRCTITFHTPVVSDSTGSPFVYPSLFFELCRSFANCATFTASKDSSGMI